MGKRQIIEELEQSGKFRKWHHFTVMQPLKPGKDNTCVISWYCDIQNLRRYLVSYHDIDILPSPISTLLLIIYENSWEKLYENDKLYDNEHQLKCSYYAFWLFPFPLLCYIYFCAHYRFIKWRRPKVPPHLQQTTLFTNCSKQLYCSPAFTSETNMHHFVTHVIMLA